MFLEYQINIPEQFLKDHVKTKVMMLDDQWNNLRYKIYYNIKYNSKNNNNTIAIIIIHCNNSKTVIILRTVFMF